MLDIKEALAIQRASAKIPEERIVSEYEKLKGLQPAMETILGSVSLVYQDKSLHPFVPDLPPDGTFNFFSIGLNQPRGTEVDTLITRTGILFFSDGRMGALPDPLPTGKTPPAIETLVQGDWRGRIESYLREYPEGVDPIVESINAYWDRFCESISETVGVS